MKLKRVKPLLTKEDCQYENCGQLATCRLFNKTYYCRLHYLRELKRIRLERKARMNVYSSG